MPAGLPGRAGLPARDVEDDQVLWAFFRGRTDRFRDGTVLRVSEREGAVDLTEKTRLVGEMVAERPVVTPRLVQRDV